MRDLVYVQWPEFQNFTFYGTHPEHYYTTLTQQFGYWEAICLRMVRLLGEPLVCQRIPTLRHYAEHERPPYKWHDDSEFGHPRPLYNLWIPLTDVPEGTLITHRQESKAMRAGEEAVVFEASESHAVRTLDVERVSIDARFIPASKYREPTDPERSVNAKTLIRLGDYYLHSDELEVRRCLT